MSYIVKNYLRVLEVISSLNCELEYKSGVGAKVKMYDIEVVALSLTSEYMSKDSENDLFKKLVNSSIPNLIERSQFNKRHRKLFEFSEKIRTTLASSFLELENYFIIDSIPLEICKKSYKKHPYIFRKSRKRIETLFSQLCDQFKIRNNYTKSFEGFKTRILAKITALTLVQYNNKFIFDRPINNIKIQII